MWYFLKITENTAFNVAFRLWSPIYTIQPVVKLVWQLVVSCIETFNRLSNPFDNRLYRVYSRLSCI